MRIERVTCSRGDLRYDVELSPPNIAYVLVEESSAPSSDSLAAKELLVPLRQLNKSASYRQSPAVSPDGCSNRFLPKSKNRSTAV